MEVSGYFISAFVRKSIEILQQAGVPEHAEGKTVYNQLKNAVTTLDRDLVVQVFNWLCKSSDAAVIGNTLQLGLWLARNMPYDARQYFDAHVFTGLFTRVGSVLGAADKHLLFLARILGDKADDDCDWERSAFWYKAIVEAVPESHIGDANLANFTTHALKKLTVLARRAKNY